MEKTYKFKVITEKIEIVTVDATSGSIALQKVEDFCNAIKSEKGFESINTSHKIHVVDNTILDILFKIQSICRTLKEFLPQKSFKDGFYEFEIFYNPSSSKIIFPKLDLSLDGFFRENITELASSRFNYDAVYDTLTLSSYHPLWHFNEEFLKDILRTLFKELKKIEV